MWGQTGNYTIDVDGMKVRIELDGIFRHRLTCDVLARLQRMRWIMTSHSSARPATAALSAFSLRLRRARDGREDFARWRDPWASEARAQGKAVSHRAGLR